MLSKSFVLNKYYRDGAEITAEEYNAAMVVIQEKAEWVNRICNGTANIEDAPAEWREEIAKYVAERQAQIDDDPELTAEEALHIIVGGAQ